MSTESLITHEQAMEACREAINAQAMAAGIHALLSAIPDEEKTDSALAAQNLSLPIDAKLKSILELI